MHDACCMHGGERPTQIDADESRLARIERSTGPHDAIQRLAVQELHPDADALFDAVRTVHGDDVRMAHARQEPCLAHDLVRWLRSSAIEDLQRHDPVEPRARDFRHPPERAASDALKISMWPQRVPGKAGSAAGAADETRFRAP